MSNEVLNAHIKFGEPYLKEKIMEEEKEKDVIKRLFLKITYISGSNTDEGRYGIIVECILARAAGMSYRKDVVNICRKLKFLNKKRQPTTWGFRWVFKELVAVGGPTIVERLNGAPRLIPNNGPVKLSF